MTPKERRKLELAFIELVGSFYPPGSAEQNAWADLWDDASELPGGILDEDRLLRASAIAMREAAHNLRRALALYGPGGPMPALYDELRATIANRTRPANEKRQDEKARRMERARQLRAVEKLTADAVGRRIAREEGRPEQPYSARQVRKWLADGKKRCS